MGIGPVGRWPFSIQDGIRRHQPYYISHTALRSCGRHVAACTDDKALGAGAHGTAAIGTCMTSRPVIGSFPVLRSSRPEFIYFVSSPSTPPPSPSLLSPNFILNFLLSRLLIDSPPACPVLFFLQPEQSTTAFKMPKVSRPRCSCPSSPLHWATTPLDRSSIHPAMSSKYSDTDTILPSV